MKYIKLFKNHSDYEAFKLSEDFVRPNVSYCILELEVHYNPYVHDYSQDYLTFEALEDGTFKFTKPINYSIDGGATWTELAANTNTPTITSGNKIMWKATLTPGASYPFGIGTFSSTGNFNVEGNPMSLLFGDNFVGQTDLTGKNYAFYELFYECSLINAKNLSLPATTLAEHCYDSMLYNTSLITAPELPATTLASGCYYRMFVGTSLITAPELPATTLANECYGGMFNGCTSLTTAPELPATTLANGCYGGMFEGCTSLTTAPELPAITLVEGCYGSMFWDCTSLNYIKAMFTTEPSFTYTGSWVSRVAASGTFVKNNAATWDVTGVNGIPEGWTVYHDPGYKYVDLGLPSGTLWATMNVGATSETDYGLYFQWGDTQGYTTDQVVSGQKAFNEADYKWSDNGSGSVYTKYNTTDGKTVLDPEDDAVVANCGGDWKMPTDTLLQELLNTTYVTNTWVTNYQSSGVNGCLFTSVSNGKTLFIPAADSVYNGNVNAGNVGGVWSSSLDSNDVSRAWHLIFSGKSTADLSNNARYYGRSIRGVMLKSNPLIVKYHVENEGDTINLFYNQGGSGSGSGSGSGGEVPFLSMEIDGVELSEVVNEYTFNTTGEHTVKYTLADPTSIGASAFNGCDKLTSIDIPNDVTSIGNQAFYQCTSLTSINIPNSVTSIGDSAFCECSGLTSVTIGSGVTSISYCAFQGCSSLTSVTIPNSVTSIGTYAFDNCSSLTSINIPDSVTSIGQYAFEGCTSLTSITMGSGVTSIDDYVFHNCRSLTSIASNATSAPTIYSSTFQSVNTGGTLTVPSGSSGYDTWMQKTNYYLGLYNWTKVEQ